MPSSNDEQHWRPDHQDKLDTLMNKPKKVDPRETRTDNLGDNSGIQVRVPAQSVTVSQP